MSRSALTKRNMLALSLGIFFDALGVALVTKSDFGISAVSSVAYVLSRVFPAMTFGMWSYTYQFFLFVLMCGLVRRCSAGYAISFLVGIVFGYTLDFCRFFVNCLPLGALLRILYFVLGTAVLIAGVAFLMISNMPIMPQDLFTRELSAHFSLPFKRVKTMFDLFCVAFSLAVSVCALGRAAGLGAGTLVSALITGRCVDWIKERLLSTKMFGPDCRRGET
ncbi:MAG: hypothetical protein KH230_23355 [Enterocloster asparagiformis]|nr:hypothetical protein [Enterocloster asparagiformis]